MKMAKTRCISLLFMFMLLAFAHSQALAGFYSGNDLIPLMQEDDKDLASTGGIGVDFVKVRDYTAHILGVCDATDFLYNLPAKATKGQIIAVVSKYLKNHPEKWGEPAAALVVRALTEAFPLKKSK
jgi:hypothetical protein